MKILLAVLIILFSANLCFGESQMKDSKEKEAVLQKFEQMQQAMIDKDMKTLNRIVKEGTLFTHMSGKTQTKAEFFEEIANGTLNYFKYEIKNPVIIVKGNYATLNAVTTLTAKVYGISGTWSLNTNASFEKIDGEWVYCNKKQGEQ